MNETQKENIRGWVADLRSGEYEQCRLSLWRGSGDISTKKSFCCLGVSMHRVDPSHPHLACSGSANSCANSMPSEAFMLEVYGLYPSQYGHLATMNDNGKKFHQIADVIEAEFLG